MTQIYILLLLLVIPPKAAGQELLFPEISGWKLMQDDPVYDANNLWDAIDGAADLYLEYSFIDLHIGRYISADSIEVKVEIYHHNSDADAFGIYSQERDPGYNFIQIGSQGYLQKGVLNFFTGSFYIKLSTYQTGEKAQEALRIISQEINKRLKQKNGIPKVFQYLPIEGKQSNTEQYVARNFLGFSFLNNAYTAQYNDRALFKLFILETKSENEANDLLKKYLAAISKEILGKQSNNRYIILDPDNGIIELELIKQYICGIIKCSDIEIRDKYINKIISILAKESY